MQKKTIAIMAAAGCMIGMLTGCGIPEEEHLGIIAELEAKHQKEVDALKVDIADLESVKKSQDSKIRTKTLELDDAVEQISTLKKQNAEAAKALAGEKEKVSVLERDLASSKSATLTAQDQLLATENKLATIEVEHEELKRRFEQFEKNMSALGTTSSAAPAKKAPEATTTAPKGDSASPLDILNQMSSQ